MLLRLLQITPACALAVLLLYDDRLGVHVVGLTAARRGWGEAVGVGVVVESVVRLCVNADVVVRKLAHLCVVDTENLGLLVAAHAAARDVVHDPENDGL